MKANDYWPLTDIRFILFILVVVIVILLIISMVILNYLTEVVGLSFGISIMIIMVLHTSWFVGLSMLIGKLGGKRRERREHMIKEQKETFGVDDEKGPENAESFLASWDYFDNENRITGSDHSERSPPVVAKSAPRTPEDYYRQRWRQH